MRSCGKNISVTCVVAALLASLMMTAPQAQSSGAADLYKEALAREGVLRRDLAALGPDQSTTSLVERIRVMVVAYEDIARLFPSSDYSDEALWHGGVLAADLFARFGNAVDRTMALRLLTALATRFPASTFARQAPAHLKRLDASVTASIAPPAPSPAPGAVALRAIRREVLPDVLRVTLDLDREVGFGEERLANPDRVFIDLLNTRPVDVLADATIPVGDPVVKQIRVGRQLDARTRLVFDVNRAGPYSVYALYNPYRIVIDFERTQPAPRPSAPSVNAGGGFSLSRQLGLGVSRIVIDPGHGGHDPGAEAGGLTEAGLVLDVAVRLERLLKTQKNVDVVLTRRADTFMSLEDRTAVANDREADLFLSIHANANARGTVRGVETYFLNFAPNPEAEAIAARENAGASRSMRELPDIVKAIAMNNKREESRDVARIVQAALFERLRKVNRNLKNLGVKQAPFMVLIGARMPAILAEISFMTNSQEAALLKTERYRQQIADALFAGVMRYQQELKKSSDFKVQSSK